MSCPYRSCAKDHYKHNWLDEILLYDLGLDLTSKDAQHPIVLMEDLHLARAKIIKKVEAHTNNALLKATTKGDER